jgi:hypothetical protein
VSFSPALGPAATNPIATASTPAPSAAASPASPVGAAAASPASPVGAAASPALSVAKSAAEVSPTAAPPAAASVSAPSAGDAPQTGRLITAASEAGHRIFMDGRLVGGGGAPLAVRCGEHEVRVGSAGQLRRVTVPCGGDVEVVR